MDDLPIVRFEDVAAWERWLEENGGASAGIWMQFGKKGSGVATISYVEAVEVALCFGWIDGQARAHDDESWLQRYTPRRKRSMWSQINRERAVALIQAGRMRPGGLAEVERAKADGRWEAAYAPQRSAEVPDDLREALEANPAARTFFETLNSQNRYAILHRLQAAKKPETRAARLMKFVEMLAAGRKIHE